MRTRLAGFFGQQIKEISAHPELQYYGAFLAAIHLLTAKFWHQPLMRLASPEAFHYCWSFFSTCQGRFVGEGAFGFLFYAYVGMAFCTTALFLARRVRVAYIGLASINLIKFYFLLLDYRLMGNYHYIPFVLSLIFLFLSNKSSLIRIFIVLIYFAAGTLKLNGQWLSGETLSPPPFFPATWFPVLCAYVVVLEVFISIGLGARRPVFRWSALLQLVAFHAVSWYWVGFFYPLVMGCVLSIFPLCWWREDVAFLPMRLARTSWAAIALFVFAQVAPRFYSRDSAVDTRGRLFALNMFDGRTECFSLRLLRYHGRSVEVLDNSEIWDERIHCDPAMYLSEMRTLCARESSDPEFIEGDIYLLSKRTTDREYQHLITAVDFCHGQQVPSPTPPSSLVPEILDPRFSGKANRPVTYQFRGDGGTGTYTQDFLRWPLRERWHTGSLNVGIHSANKSSPAVDATGIYVGADTGWFYAFNLNGTVRWKYYCANAVRGIHGTAALDEEFVYFGCYNGRMYSLRKSDGQLAWTVKLGDAIGASPLIIGNFMFITFETKSDGTLVKLERLTGRPVWQAPWSGDQVHSSPVFDPTTATIFYGANSGRLAAVAAANGNQGWSADVRGPIKGAPMFVDGSVYTTSWSKRMFRLDSRTGIEKWSADLIGISQNGPAYWPGADLVVAGSAAKGTSQVAAFDRQSGARRWSFQYPATHLIKDGGVTVRASQNSPYYLWMSCESEAICAFTPTGKIVQKLKLRGHATGSPAIFRGHLYVVTEGGGLARFDGINANY